MATKKTGNDKTEQTRTEAAEALRKAAELIASLNQQADALEEQPKKAPAKKPAAKSTTAAKKPATKSTAAKKPATKSTATKKPAAKKDEEKPEEKPVEEPVAETPAEEKPAAKKPAAKSTTAKKPAAKSTAAKKPAAKKDDDETARLKAELEAAKKEAADAHAARKAAEADAAHHAAEAQKAKAAANAETEIARANAEAEIAKANAEAEKAKANAEAEKAKAAAEAEAAKAAANAEAEIARANAEAEKARAAAEAEAAASKEEKPEEPAADTAPVQNTTTTTTTVTVVEKKGAAKVADKTDKFIHGKGKLPIFIVVNALMLLSSIMLLTMPFAIGDPSKYYTLFSFLGNGDAIKTALVGHAGEWANGGYVILGILMWFAFLLPLALVVKNVIIAIRKKNFNVYKFDAIVTYAFMLFYFAMVNLFGTNITVGQVFAYVVSALNLVFVLLSMFLTKNVKSLPFFSFVNIILATLAIFILVSHSAVKPNADGSVDYIYAAFISDLTGAGGFFVMLLFAIAVLITLIIMQIRRLPKIVEIIVPLAAAVLSIIGIIILGASMGNLPTGWSTVKLSGGLVFGVILTILIAIADTLFTFLKPLKKYKNMIGEDGTPAPVTAGAAAPAEEETVTTTTTTTVTTTTEAAPAEEKAEEKPADAPAQKFCSACGQANPATAAYCKKCGHKLN